MGLDDLQFGDIWTSDDFKNQGIASTSLKYLLEIHHEKKIWFLCIKSNEASVKLALKCGFELVGTGTKKSRFLNIFSQYILLNKI
jgi:RimJ/RimL family protein N-acetyltransferase